MNHTMVYQFFENCFPDLVPNVRTYFPNGRNSIRIRRSTGDDLIFSVLSPKEWKLETVDQFIAHMSFPNTDEEKNYG